MQTFTDCLIAPDNNFNSHFQNYLARSLEIQKEFGFWDYWQQFMSVRAHVLELWTTQFHTRLQEQRVLTSADTEVVIFRSTQL